MFRNKSIWSKDKTSHFCFLWDELSFLFIPSGRTNEVKLLMLKIVSDKRLFEPSAAQRELAMMMDSFLFDLFELYKNSKRDFILRRLAESSLCLWALSFDLFQQWYDEILKREKKWSMNDINRMWWWAVAQWPGYGSQLCLVIGKSELAYTREMSVKAENAKLPKRLLSSSYWSSLWAIFKPPRKSQILSIHLCNDFLTLE